jgi:hypothetical protein
MVSEDGPIRVAAGRRAGAKRQAVVVQAKEEANRAVVSLEGKDPKELANRNTSSE